MEKLAAHDVTLYAELLGVSRFDLSSKPYRPITNVACSTVL
jgi:hypothetical protein